MTRLTATFLLVLIGLCLHAQPGLQELSTERNVHDSNFRFAALNVVPSRSVFIQSIQTIFSKKLPVQAVLGTTKGKRPIDVFYFPGTSNLKALVIGGVHGSELSSVEIAKRLVRELSKGGMPFYNVVVIPCLFPDNAATAIKAGRQRVEDNKGRYTTDHATDPNRQMPALGTAFDAEKPFDGRDRVIENENQLLLDLIQEYNPSRILNIHAIKDLNRAGVYADPRTDCNSIALGFESDSLLAIKMAVFIQKHGGQVPGNQLPRLPTALYYTDPQIAEAGTIQKRNTEGSRLPNERGSGVSLGSWAATAVCQGSSKYFRPAIRLITVEFPGYRRPEEYKTAAEQKRWSRQIDLYTASILNYFLEEFFAEAIAENPVASK